jgi:hypothetical protein
MPHHSQLSLQLVLWLQPQCFFAVCGVVVMLPTGFGAGAMAATAVLISAGA